METLDSYTKKQHELKLRNNIAQDIQYKFLPLCDCNEHDPTGSASLIKKIIGVIQDGI